MPFGTETANINKTFTTAEACSDEIGPPGTLQATCVAVRNSGNKFNVVVPNDPYLSKDGSTQQRIDAYEATYGNRYIRIYGNAPITAALSSPPTTAWRTAPTPATRMSSTR